MNLEANILQFRKIAAKQAKEFNKLGLLDHYKFFNIKTSPHHNYNLQGKGIFNPEFFAKKQIRKITAQKIAISGINAINQNPHLSAIRLNSGKLVSSHLWDVYNCQSELVIIDGFITSKRCKSRICPCCGAARTSELIEKYLEDVRKFKDPRFLTLTYANVNYDELRPSIDTSQKILTNIMRSARRAFGKFKAIRKIEITYNESNKTYHPHFHFIIENKNIALYFIQKWMKKMREKGYKVHNSAQDQRKAENDTMRELFKYELKLPFEGAEINGEALIYIILALNNKRCIQGYGFKPKKIELHSDTEDIMKFLELAPEILKIDNYIDEKNFPLPINGYYIYYPKRGNWYSTRGVPLLENCIIPSINLRFLNKYNIMESIKYMSARRGIPDYIFESNAEKISIEKLRIATAIRNKELYSDYSEYLKSCGKLDKFGNYQMRI